MRQYFGKAALLAATGLAVSAMLPASASAAETFGFASGGSNSSNTYGNVRTFTGSAGTKVEVSAFTLNGSSLTTSFVGQYSGWGLGVTNRGETGSSPNHAIDNSGYKDFVVLQFDHVVTVSELGIRGFGYDTDLTYAVGTTVTPFSGTLSIANQSALNSLFGSYTDSNGNVSNGLVARSVNAGALSGNLFLVGAKFTDSNDYFKLHDVTATVVPPPPVPEPATWALMIGGFGLAGAAMRRRNGRTAVRFA